MALRIEVECESRAGKLEFDDFGFAVATPAAVWLCLCPTSGSGFETVTSSCSRTVRGGLERSLARWAHAEWGTEVVEQIRQDVLSQLPEVGDEASAWPLIACFQQAGFGFAFAGPYAVSVVDGEAWRELAVAHWQTVCDAENPVATASWAASGVGPGYKSASWTTMSVPIALARQVRINCGAWSLPARPNHRLVGGWAARLLLKWSGSAG